MNVAWDQAGTKPGARRRRTTVEPRRANDRAMVWGAWLAAAGAGAMSIAGMWLVLAGGEPWQIVRVVVPLALVVVGGILWRRRARKARWLTALDAYAVREIARTRRGSPPARRGHLPAIS